MACNYCGREITDEQLLNARRGNRGGHLKVMKYCSVVCTKRSWNRRKRPNVNKVINTASYIGRRGELLATQILEGAEDMNASSFGNPGFDLMWNGAKVDVKCKNYTRHRGSKQWSFCFSSTDKDYYLLICLEDDEIVKALYIPSNSIPSGGITVGENSKYDKYKICIPRNVTMKNLEPVKLQ